MYHSHTYSIISESKSGPIYQNSPDKSMQIITQTAIRQQQCLTETLNIMSIMKQDSIKQVLGLNTYTSTSFLLSSVVDLSIDTFDVKQCFEAHHAAVLFSFLSLSGLSLPLCVS